MRDLIFVEFILERIVLALDIQDRVAVMFRGWPSVWKVRLGNHDWNARTNQDLSGDLFLVHVASDWEHHCTPIRSEKVNSLSEDQRQLVGNGNDLTAVKEMLHVAKVTRRRYASLAGGLR